VPAAVADLSLDELLELAAGDENHPDAGVRVTVVTARAEVAMLGPGAAALLAARRTYAALSWREKAALAAEAADPAAAILGRAGGDPPPEHDDSGYDGQPVLDQPPSRS
jgi:hypothetical protein